MTTATTTAHGAGEGPALWMLNSLVTVKAASAATGGTLSVLEQLVTPAGNPPLHVHAGVDEAFYVLDGELDLVVGDGQLHCAPGAFAWTPRGVPHTYAVRSPSARLLVIGVPGGLDEFFAEVGEPAAAAELPVPSAPDVERVAGVASRHGIDLVGPPLA